MAVSTFVKTSNDNFSNAGLELRASRHPKPPSFQRVTQVKPYRSGRVTAIATENGRTSRIAAADFIVTTQKKPVYSIGYHPKYRGGGIFGLCDGLTGSEQFSDGHWQGFSGDDLETTFELPETANIREVRAGFLENTGVWIFPPRKLTVLTSEDGIQFEKAGEWTPPAPPAENRPARIERASVSFSERPTGIRGKVSAAGFSPMRSAGSRYQCMIFLETLLPSGSMISNRYTPEG